VRTERGHDDLHEVLILDVKAIAKWIREVPAGQSAASAYGIPRQPSTLLEWGKGREALPITTEEVLPTWNPRTTPGRT
jgi:hypothetical protein